MAAAVRHGALTDIARSINRLLSPGLWVGLLVLSGIFLWFPGLYRLSGSHSFWILGIHIAVGTMLTLALAWSCRSRSARASIKEFWYASIPGFKSHLASTAVVRLILICIAALLASGTGLVFSRATPPALCEVFLYLHGAGSLILIMALGLTVLGVIANKKGMLTKPADADDEWRSQILSGVFELPLTHASIHNKVEGFLQVFGWILKQSKLRLFLDDYRRAVECKDIFADRPDTESPFTPGDYLISIYVKYFTFYGWINRGVFSGKGLTARHIDQMASVFYGYVPFNRCRDFDDGIAHQGLMAKYGRFILSEMGIVPNAAATDSMLQRSLKLVETDVLQTTGIRVPLSLDKKHSDIVLFPTVDYYFLQVDTLRWLIVILHALQCNWTIGKAIYDGFNYGAFFGDWFVDRVLERLKSKARGLGAKKILLGGCQGVPMTDQDGLFFEVNDLLIEAIASGKLQVRNDGRLRRVGFAGFCDEGCHINRSQGSAKILAAMGWTVVEIGNQNAFASGDQDLIGAIREHDLGVLIGPYHNSRKRLEFLINQNNLKTQVYELYEFIAMNIKPISK